MDRADGAAIRLCGRLMVAPRGRDVSAQLPGRQGRLLLACLAYKPGRPVTRDHLIDVIWPHDPPALPDEVLGSLLSKVRRVLGPGVIEGRHDLTLVLPEGGRVDVELAANATELGEAALGRGDPGVAIAHAQAACELTEESLLPGFDNPWVEERRREVEELRLRALGCVAGAGLALGEVGFASGERAARELISVAPLSERGHRLLIEILAERGDVAAALQAYDALRVRLRDELGIAPGPAVRALHQRLLATGDEVDAPVDDRGEPDQAPHREERKLVTVVAAELVEPEACDDPEELRATAARLQARFRGEMGQFGGTVEHSSDRMALALFGATVAHEDDAERAVRAALRLRELGLARRAGVATGEMLVAPHSPGGTATGRAIDKAVRIQRRAAPGGVYADELTVRAVPPDAVVCDALDEGISVVQAVSDRLSAALEHPFRTRFLGRENELMLLKSVHNSVLEHRHPSMVLILGHAGVGKSRLIDEFLKHVERSAPSVFRGRCLAYGEGTTYWALREVLWAAADIRFDETAAVAAQKLRRLVSSVLGRSEPERVSAALAIASGIALPDNFLERLSPGSVADEVALAWPAFLSGLAALEPVIVVIEDLHWAEHPLVEMLERVVARSAGPLLLIVSARPELVERRAGWSTRPGTSQLSLEPLPEDVSRELVSELLPRVDAKVHDLVLTTAEGNPFFAEELARHISDDRGDPTEIPNTVRAVLTARIDGLPEAEKHVLQDAAVVGRVFWAPVLEAIEPRRSLREVLRRLENRGLVVVRPTLSLPGQTELWFRHGLTREVAYRSIPRARRCRTHAAVGQWLERLAGDRRDEFIDLLAHHYEAAAVPADAALAWPDESSEPEHLRQKAVAALIHAGDVARKRSSLAQALRFAERAEALAATDHERLAVLELRARTHHAAVRSDEALAAYTRAIELARGLGLDQTLARLRAHAILLCVRYAGAFTGDSWRAPALKLINQGLAEGAGDAVTFERGAVLLGRGWGVHRWDETQRHNLRAAKRDAARAIAIAEAVDSPELHAAALEGLTWLVSEEGFCQVGRMGERLNRASSSSADRVEAHESKVTAASCFAWAGRFDLAIDTAREAAAEAASLSPHRALHSAMAQAFALVPAGRFAELGERTGEVLDLANEDASNARTCMSAVVGIAGRALWLYESLQFDAATNAVDFMTRVRPSGTARSKRGNRALYESYVSELLRPIIGSGPTLAALDDVPPPPYDTAATILYLRAKLPALALTGETTRLGAAIAAAHKLAGSACAPVIGWIADWAGAVQTATYDPTGSLQRALSATTALEKYGETYTAARLLTDFMPLVQNAVPPELAEETAERLTLMGAPASAASARAVLGRT